MAVLLDREEKANIGHIFNLIELSKNIVNIGGWKLGCLLKITDKHYKGSNATVRRQR